VGPSFLKDLTQAKQTDGKLTLENRGNVTALLCNGCQRPFATIENGEFKILSKHGSKIDENVLTAEHLRMIAFEMWRQGNPPERW